MNNAKKNKPGKPMNDALAALIAHRISKKEKRAWIMVGVALIFLLLCWWARTFQ